VSTCVRRLAKAYYIAKREVLSAGYAPEIDWQYSLSIEGLQEQAFLREAAWVILSCGISERVVRRKFPCVSDAFLNWETAHAIMGRRDLCRFKALGCFNNRRKIDAILSICEFVSSAGFSHTLNMIYSSGTAFLRRFSFIGPATSLHLAKNIGLPFAKPDRHLVRIAQSFGYTCVQQLCRDVSLLTDEPVAVVDIVLWRYATLKKMNVERFHKLVVCDPSVSATDRVVE
jgi:hypothetical protein